VRLVVIIALVGAIYTAGLKMLKIKEIPFTPVILAAYVGLWSMGVI